MSNENVQNSSFEEENKDTFPARMEEFSSLQIWLDKFMNAWNVSAKIRKQILVTADEIFTNIVSYAYPSGDGTVEVSIKHDMKNDQIVLTFSDHGTPFDPLEAPPPPLDQTPEERPIGGLGIHFVRNFMDSVEYRRENERNILTLRKNVRIS